MKKIVAYLLFVLVVAVALFALLTKGDVFPGWIMERQGLIKCALAGMLGGVLYCMRSVYLNRCVKDRWNEQWHVWYVLRPIVSSICGVVAYLILKAGLVVLDASSSTNSGQYGYMAFALFAGLNVDKFVAKLEELGMAVFGIEKSRASASTNTENKE